MIVFIEVIDRADVKSHAVPAADRRRRLIIEFAADDELVRHLLLQQPAEIPIVFVVGAAAVIDPVPAASVGRPVIEALLQPKRKIEARVTGPKTTAQVSSRDLDEWKGTDLRTNSFFVLLNEPVFEAELGIAVAELGRAAGRAVERHRRNDVELSVWNKAVVELDCRAHSRRIAA